MPKNSPISALLVSFDTLISSNESKPSFLSALLKSVCFARNHSPCIHINVSKLLKFDETGLVVDKLYL